jgi:hypothetical protein
MNASAAGSSIFFRIPSPGGSLLQSDNAVFWNYLTKSLILLATILVLATFRDYGVTWDEDVHNWYGNFVLNYYLSFFQDTTALHWQDLYNYGAVFDMLAAALNRISPIGVYETRHLLNGLVGVLGLIGCAKLAGVIANGRTAFIAALFLVLTPNYYGQMFNNPKDIPFAVGVVWASYYMVRIIPDLPRPPFGYLTKLGVAIGLTMGVRIGGLLLIFYLGLLLAADGVWRTVAARRASLMAVYAWTSLWRVLIPVVLIAYSIMLLFWPWGQTDPIENPLRALAFFSHQSFPFYTLFAGQFIPASNLPWSYLPTYIGIALPELVLVLLLSAPVLAAAGLLRNNFTMSRTQALTFFLIGIAIVFPVAYAIAIKAVLFDGMRHFIFVLPLIAVVAALAAEAALGRLTQFRYRRPIWLALAVYGIIHIAIMVMLHPNQYVYYNAFVGGVEGAQRKFKLDYWANSYAEAVQGLQDYLRTQYGADFEDREFTIAVCGPPSSAGYYFPPNFRFVREQQLADFFIAFTKDNCDRSLHGRPVYQVERMGALLSVVLDRRDFVERRIANRPAAGAPSSGTSDP